MATAKLEGGYYIVGGQPVDANGKPIPAELVAQVEGPAPDAAPAEGGDGKPPAEKTAKK